ncbi:MAG TPA: SctK family type III secretion system sorting platform protein [Thiolinea sp.]|nr:SctK family type III secretion system sorting platform protein [Thiolinea sp.]
MSNEQADTIRSNKKLSSLVWEFNFRPDHYIHDSWLEKMPDGPLIRKLVGKHRSAERIVQHLFQRFGLENQVFFHFSNSLTRIALWSGKDLEKLVLHTGSVLYYPKIQHIIVREDVQKIRELVGEDIFMFMQRSANHLRGKMDLELDLPRKLPPRKWLVLAGMACFMTALQDYPPALRKRLLLKLPQDWYELHRRFRAHTMVQGLQQKECSALIQKTAIEIRMGVGIDGQIRFS